MLDVNIAIDLMKKYGYTSTSVHPYVYENDNAIGVCYSFIDDCFGILERVAIFRTADEMDDFLKKYQWFKQHGKENKVTMKLDDYESPSPNIIYYRKGRVMAFDEMFNLEKYDNLEIQKRELNEIDKYILEADSLINLYNTFKDEQINFSKHVNELVNEQKKKYYELQLLVDKYNETTYDRKLLESNISNINAGININMERALKERLSQYKATLPDKKEAKDFINEVWNLCKNLELNDVYYNNKVLEQNITNDIKIANLKINLMNELLNDTNNFLNIKKDLQNLFNKLDTENLDKFVTLPNDFVETNLKDIELKYSYFDKLDILKVNEYLTEAKNNKNYSDLALKYTVNTSKEENNVVLDYEEVIKNLDEQFNKLTPLEQNSLILYFSSFKDLLSLIISVNNYENLSINDLIIELEKNTKFKDLKKNFYDNCKEAINLPTNIDYKKSIFATYDFTSLETFIESCLKTINVLKNINMKIASDTLVYFQTNDYDNLEKSIIIDTVPNISLADDDAKTILATIKKNTKVIYTNRIIDFGDYSNTATYSIKEQEDKKISLRIDNCLITKNDKNTIVSNYSSESIPKHGISIVDKLNLYKKNEYYNIQIENKIIDEGNKK